MSNGEALEPGMAVYTAEGTDLGSVKRIRHDDGSVEPAETTPVTGTMRVNPGSRSLTHGYFLVSRPLAPDWYVPFSAIRDVLPGRVVLNVTIEEARRFPWQELPA
jgi:hypothetical protein